MKTHEIHPSRPPIIGLLGRMRAGKDTIGRALVETYRCVPVSFALAVKEELAERHGITLEELEQNKSKYRVELQELGHGRTEEDPNYWVNKAMPKIEAHTMDIEAPTVVVTDCRYPHEIEALLEKNAFILKVVTPDHVRIKRILDSGGSIAPQVLQAPSEQSVDTCMYHQIISGMLDYSDISKIVKILYSNWKYAGEPVSLMYGSEFYYVNS